MTRKSLVLLAVVIAVFVVADLRHVISGDAIILLAVLVPSVILHEVSHGYVAMLFGDDTAKRAGRLTLNPIAHIDPVGSFLLPVLLIFAGLTPIGYAKPVPVSISNLRSPRNQSVFVSLSGPAVNIILSVVAGILLHLRISQAMASSGLFPVAQITLGPSLVDRVLFNMGAINLLLGVFNLIPIPPLDGSAVVERVLPAGALAGYFRLRRLMLPVVLVLFLVFPGAIGRVFTPIIDLWIRIFAQ